MLIAKILICVLGLGFASASDGLLYEDTPPSLRLVGDCEEFSFDNLKKKGYRNCSSEFYADDYDYIFVKLSEDKIFDSALFVHFEYSEKDEQKEDVYTHLKSQQCYVNDNVFKETKWDVPRPLALYMGKRYEAIELSWKYIDHILHVIPGGEYPIDVIGKFSKKNKYQYPSAEVRELFLNIGKNGLQNSFARYLIKRAQKHFYVYSDDAHGTFSGVFE